MLLAELVDVSAAVRATRSRKAKTAALADLLRRVGSDEAPIAVSYLSGEPLQDRLGVGHVAVYDVDVVASDSPSLDLNDVDRRLEEISSMSGPGSKAAKTEALGALLGLATAEEQDFLRGLILRALRQGALLGVMGDAVAEALDVDAAAVRRAAMVSGSLTEVAGVALADGAGALEGFELTPLVPIQPMLAKTADTAADAVEALGASIVDHKLDGARIQVHRLRSDTRVFSRNMNDITTSRGVGAIVEAAVALEAESFILDGEALVMGPGARPLAFQDSMGEFLSTNAAGSDVVLSAFYFDCLHLNGRNLIDEPLTVRRTALTSVVGPDQRVDWIETTAPDEAEAFYQASVAAGHEGVVIKAADSLYDAGRRGGSWLKVKPAHTLDLVVLAVEWGSGRRKGFLSNIHLGARAEDGSGFVMLGKTFKGMTDEMLAWQTDRFLELETSRDGHVVFVRPEQIVEIAFDGVQRSKRYPGGMALRFARVKRYREDKEASEADTVETLRAIMGSTASMGSADS